MARIDTSDVKALREAVNKYLGELPGDLVCALQVWYEGLSGHGVMNPAETAAVEAAVEAAPGWKPVGEMKYEKFGAQNSYKRV